jgi:hypothetical protein
VVNWAEVTLIVTVGGGIGGLIYQAGRLTRSVQALEERVASIERWIRDRSRR